MIFVTGPFCAGKQDWICGRLSWTEEDFARFGRRDVQELAAEAEDLDALAEELAAYGVVISTEVGGGVVPLEAEARRSREAAGRLACLLAEKADTVVRVFCGLGQVLKGSLPRKTSLYLELIRHGETDLQRERRYQGSTDAPLSQEGRAKLMPADWKPEVVAVTSLRRTAETADLLFPGVPQRGVPGLREMEFGAFEGHNYLEMAEDADYRAWVEGGCEGRCPDGESGPEFRERIGRAWMTLLSELLSSGVSRCAVVAHGGTQMAVMSRFGPQEGEYFSWQSGCGEGYRLEVKPGFPPGAFTLTGRCRYSKKE